ncbi:MAG: family N-acetyltransferase [Rhodoglobus sp.]|nr:family N-acetyltransferase [Rhodoglobus sp.]
MSDARDYTSLPIDAVSAAALASHDLRLGLVDTADAAAFTAWLRADHRGFHLAEAGDEIIAASLTGLAYRRTTGVWDESARDAASPVATVNSWTAGMTVPGGSRIEAWAISSVTVAPTHRRKGIARALLEAELRTAAALGIPLATLTVSESTIYGRFGFAPAAFANELTIDTRRAAWTGPASPGRLHFLTAAEFRAELPALHERIRATGVGQLDAWDLRWDALAGLITEDKERAKNLRAIRYDDADGALRGLALYRVSGGDPDFAAHTLTVEYLASETDDAYAALWRYLLEVDLVSMVKAFDRPVDEPLVWQVADMRAVKQAPYDHVWTRILDVPRALSARSYAAPLETVIEVSDDLDFTAGRYSLSIADGAAVIERTDAPADLALRINELSALHLGGVSAAALTAAGRITELRAGAAAALELAFRTSRAPWLSFWF